MRRGDSHAGDGEVRVRLSYSGITHGDVIKRSGWMGFGISHQRIIPLRDGAGVIDTVGECVPGSRIGNCAWVWGAQSYRAFGTAAQLVTVPSWRAADLPENVSDKVGAWLGHFGHDGAPLRPPGRTGHR